MGPPLLNVKPWRGESGYCERYYYYHHRQGKLRGLQLVLVATADTHLRVAAELEKVRRDSVMGLVMARSKVAREAWQLEALVVVLELFLASPAPAPGCITRSDGMKCAVIRELRGMSEVRIQEPAAEQQQRRVSITITNEDAVPRKAAGSRDLSCPPTSGWRARLLVDQESEQRREAEVAGAGAGRQQEPAPAPQEKVGGESKERRMRRVRRGSARKRLDTINSESEYSVRFCVSTKMWLTLKNIFL